jgi:hypothetical protein
MKTSKTGSFDNPSFQLMTLSSLLKRKIVLLQMYVDYHGLNQLTIKNQYPLPFISRLLDQLNHAKVYIKIDLHGAYNLVCIRKGNEWNTKFKIHYGHFEYIVMPFAFFNALVVFQHLLNNVFREYLDNFVVCYIDDIFIFSNNMEDQECHVHVVLEKFWEVGFYTKLEKCEFQQFEMEFLGHNMSEMTFIWILVTLAKIL